MNFYQNPLSINNVLIFGPYTSFFISLIATLYLLSMGGTAKGIYGGLFFNLLVIAFSYYLNTAYSLNLDLLLPVIFEICLVIMWVMLVAKIT